MPVPVAEHITHAVQQVLPQARVAWLFGSAAHGGERFGPQSDIDLAVRLPQPLSAQDRLHASEQLAALLGHDVDLLDFDRASTVMQVQVLHTGQLLFDHAGAENLDYCSRVMTEYQHIQRWRQPMMRQLAEQLRQATAPHSPSVP